MSTLNSRMTSKDVQNSVSKFGGILFTPIQLNVVACYASGPLKVRLSFRSQNVTLHKHRYIYICRHTVTAHFSQLTNKVLTPCDLIITCNAVHCVLKYQHWHMKQTVAADQKGCQWHTAPI